MKKNYGPIYTMPLIVWITVFFSFPTLIIFLYSFMTKDTYGGVIWSFSLDAYRALFNTTFLVVVYRTVYIAVLSTALTIALALPTAYFIARSPHKNTLLFLIVVPFWTSFLVRIYSWIAILGNEGFLNDLLKALGLIKDHIQFLYNPYAIIIVTVYTYLSYAILPLYASIEKFDFSLVDAAMDLGATRAQAIFKILLPNIKAGITTSVLFTFIPALGSYAIPQIIGGTESLMMGNIIASELMVTRNWPLSSSISIVLTAITIIGVYIFLKANQNGAEKAKKITVGEKYA